MNSNAWLRYYQRNPQTWTDPAWHVPCPLDQTTKRALALSLSHFQLGETGEGSFLFAQAREQAPDDIAYRQALELFISEEQAHAGLLEQLVHRFGGQTIKGHWTHRLFRLVRRTFGLHFELQVLVIAELIGTAYYRLLHLRSRDPVLEQVCARILRDESQHLGFHADWLSDFQLRLLPLEHAAWSAQFQILFSIAAQVAWIDHRHCLYAVGANHREFFREARRECIYFLKQLERTSSTYSTDSRSLFPGFESGDSENLRKSV
jgi:rubrerythrin